MNYNRNTSIMPYSRVILALFISFVFLPKLMSGQNNSVSALENSSTQNNDAIQTKFKVGVETNILPFLYNGYHGSIWGGKNGYRLRLVTAKTDYPSSTVPEGFSKVNLTFYEVEFDAFFGRRKSEFIGFWLASGIGRTTHEATTSNGISDKTTTTDIHFGIGYTFSVWKGLTVNPWVGGAWHTDFPDEIVVGSEIWRPNSLSPVGGLKIGYTIF
ncbi:hypothetical protein [Flavivirga rizhaonensis]|uniref:DUF3575 domain-containing protein n=1 Tax=Flavivirga rizhaonensis TaxID=2559571 RepID=A0A4S1DRX7_9FLAO|nr:hypothetical protein [Flavivirga rizhaonensis]TGV00740.1 hypothetical protein EM932_18305 [Flavivirga rizhaonensis]